MTPPGAGEQTFRRWSALATLLAMAFVVYGSLMPFRFAGPFTVRRALDTFLSSWPKGRISIGDISHSDFVANICLYLPIGFFGGVVLVRHGAGLLRWLVAAMATLFAAVVLSLTVELLQVFVPSRSSSVTDVLAAIVGTIVGWLGWRVLAADVMRWSEQWIVGDRARVVRAALAVYSLVLILIILWPLDITLDRSGLAHKLRTGGVVLNPLRSPAMSLGALPAMLLAFLMAIPVGAWASVAGARGPRRPGVSAALLAIGLFAAVEAVQVLILSCRADSFEFIVNASGALAGVLLTTALVRQADPRRSSPAELNRSRIWILGLTASLLFYAVYNLSPFNFTMAPDLIRDRIGDLWGTPFYGYYINPQFKALGDALTKISLGVPIGLFLQLWLGAQPMPYTRAASIAGVFLATVFLTAVEAGQVILPTRYPDDTDIILAVVGVVLAMWAVRALGGLTHARGAVQPQLRARGRRHSSRHSRRRAGLPTSQDR